LKVSVCIPTYNSARFLAGAIDSVLAQSFADFELVVCDNASDDSTPELCRGYRDARIRYVRYEQLVSQGGNWNRCVAIARGDYVALLHADDEYKPAFLAERVAALDRSTDAGMAFGAVEIIDGPGRVLSVQRFRVGDTWLPAPEGFGELLMGCCINPASPVVRRACYEQVGAFDEHRLWGIDWEMWLRLAARFGVAYSASADARYRVHGESGSAHGINGARRCREDRQVLEAALQRVLTEPTLQRFRPLRRAALHRLGLSALHVAGSNAVHANRRGIADSVRCALQADPWLALKPTVWALALASALGPSLYRRWERIRTTDETYADRS
jgi:glycosyltransferase involved in cell wall biosynthesis